MQGHHGQQWVSECSRGGRGGVPIARAFTGALDGGGAGRGDVGNVGGVPVHSGAAGQMMTRGIHVHDAVGGTASLLTAGALVVKSDATVGSRQGWLESAEAPPRRDVGGRMWGLFKLLQLRARRARLTFVWLK